MTVRELIEALLDYEMDNDVEIHICIGNDEETLGFEVEDSVYTKGVELTAVIEGHELIEEGRLEELLDKEAELEDIKSV